MGCHLKDTRKLHDENGFKKIIVLFQDIEIEVIYLKPRITLAWCESGFNKAIYKNVIYYIKKQWTLPKYRDANFTSQGENEMSINEKNTHKLNSIRNKGKI